MAVDYTKPTGNWYLTDIKYALHLTWPNSTFEGYGVCAWGMSGGVPGSIIWPFDGVPIYNPNSSGTPGDPGNNYKWVIQDVTPNLLLPNTFMVSITFLYDNPNSDAIACDNAGPCSHDWTLYPAGWMTAPYGRQMIRAIIWHDDAEAIEATSIGKIRTLYR